MEFCAENTPLQPASSVLTTVVDVGPGRCIFTIFNFRIVPAAAERIKRTVQIDSSTVEIEERGVKLR